MNSFCVPIQNFLVVAVCALVLITHGAPPESEGAERKDKQLPVELVAQREHAMALAKDGKLLEAEAAFTAIIRNCDQMLGADHSFTLRNRMGLVTVIEWDGRLHEAEDGFRAVLKDQERVLGPDHEDCVITRDGLAATLGALGQFDAAEKLTRAIIETREKL